MREDWYAATVHRGADEILGALLAAADGASFVDGSPMYGYLRGARIQRGDSVLVSAWWGGNGEGTHLVATGDRAPWLVGQVREQWPEHVVTRVDVAEDFDEEDAWPQLSQLALGVADRRSLRVTHHGDFHRAEHGRTLVVGAPSSVARVRVYEKGRQLGPPASPNWVRVELQSRPRREARVAAARATPAEQWGITGWTSELVHEVAGASVTLLPASSVYRESDAQRALGFMVRQYGKTIHAAATELGGWCSFSAELRGRVAAELGVALED